MTTLADRIDHAVATDPLLLRNALTDVARFCEKVQEIKPPVHQHLRDDWDARQNVTETVLELIDEVIP